tara:strand:+ start:1014 stop:5627 length:4614 start_codon:yes stop_codon:yes gene_type:complete
MDNYPEDENKTDTWGDSIQWDETYDFDENMIDSNENKSEWGIIPTLGEIYIILFHDKTSFLGTVNNIENQEGKYFTLKNEKKSLLFQTQENDTIKMKTEDYEIIDIKKIKKYDIKLLEVPESLKEKIVKDNEIAYTLVDEKDRSYTKYELKEILISTLYSQYNKNSQEKALDEIIEYADILIDISGEEIMNKKSMGKWYVPIITNETRIISEENDTYDEIKELNDNDMLITENNTNQDKNYISLMKNLLHLWDNILYSENDDGLLINDYEGKAYCNCLNSNNCSGINGLYSFNEIRNNKFLRIPTTFDRITGNSNFMILRNPMKLNIMGVLTIPYHYFPFFSESFLYIDNLSLFEKCIFQELVKQTNIHKRKEFKNNVINSRNYNGEKYDYEINSFTIHKFNSQNKEILIDDINKIKPSVKNILKTFDNKIIRSLKNYQDIFKLLINYEIDHSEINKDYKYINEILKNNTETYAKNTKIFKLKHKNIVKKELDIEKRILLSKDIIFGILNIPFRNILIKRFIDTFCIDSSEEENWYVGIHDKKRLLCKHYAYLSGEKDKEAFFMMKQKYQQLPPQDGNIYCKNCGEFICQEEFSYDDGFSDDLPTSTKEVLIQDKDPLEKYDESDINNIALLKNISQGMGIEIKDNDIILIIDTYNSLSDDIIANKRYDMLNITISDEHPRVSEIKKKYKKDKKLLTKSIKSFQLFLKITNRILVFITLSMLIISTAIPVYENKYMNDFKLFNENNESNKDFISKITLVFNKLSYTFGEKYEKVYKDLYNEKKSYNVLQIDSQIDNMIQFFLTSNFPKILTRFNEYLTFKKNIDKLYINYEWSIYKPLTSNKLVSQINKELNKDNTSKSLQLKTYNKTNIENITGISGIDDYNLHKELDIQKNILTSSAFQRLFNLSVSLHGKLEKPNFYLDTNIEKFYNESNDDIKEIFIKSGWNNKTKTIGPANFKEIRRNTIPNILKIFYNKSDNDMKPCFTLKEYCNDYIHISINNYELPMINVKSKRYYKHIIPEIFPNVNYNIINDNIKTKIFKTFAFDPTNRIIKKESSNNYLGKFLLEISNCTNIDIEDKSSEYEKEITKNEKNFHKIIEYCHNKSKLRYSYINIPQEITNESLKNITNKSYINEYFNILENKDLDFNSERFINILNVIDDNKENISSVSKELTTILLEIEEKNNEYLGIISSLLKLFLDNNISFKERFHNIFHPEKKSHIKLTIESRKYLESFGNINYNNLSDKNLEDIFRILIEDETFDIEYINDTINETLYIISNIINKGYKVSHIPKSWRLSNINKEWYKKYVETHYFSNHKDLYKKNNFKDFSEYFNKAENYFSELFDNITNITNGINLQRNITGVLTDNIKSFWKNIYLSFIKEIITLSDNLRNIENIDENDEDNINILEKFSIDIIIHLFEKRYDTTWIYTNKQNLSELLGVQKEREKQKLIHKLDGMNNDKRHSTTELHAIGTKNYFKASEVENMEYIEEEGYKNETDNTSYISQLMTGEVLNDNTIFINDNIDENYDTGEIIDDDGGNMS